MRRWAILCATCVALVWTAAAVDPPKREVRAVWLTTVYGLDWPQRPARDERSRQAQQEALREILDSLAAAHFNTVFLQARLRGDVIYRSAIEPASRVFSGKTGELPGYDPLAFAIEECHRRGMECHAWFVTYPLGTERSVRQQGRLSVVRRRPELCKRHKGEWYLDPGAPGTTDYLLSLVRELVENYDIDGIHFDYLRYPEEANRFPDKSLHRRHGRSMSLADWRRQNITNLVTRAYDLVKSLKPWVQVSCAPLGKYSRIKAVPNAGWTAYESVYQDPQRWMKAGKLDMVVPMMYYLHRNFFPFVDNWVANAAGRLVVPGLGAYRLDAADADWALNDVTDQMDYSRHFGGVGNAFFRCGSLLSDTKGLYRELRDRYYRYPAQLPPLTWLNDSVPAAPEAPLATRQGDTLRLSWQKPAGETRELTYTVYYAQADTLDPSLARSILATNLRETELYLPVGDGERGLLFRVTASTRYHVESPLSRETYYYWSAYEK